MALSSHQECRGCPSGESFHLKIENKRERRIDEFTLINETAQIDEAHIVGTSRAAVIGRALPNTSIVNLLDLSKATLLDSFFCHLPSVSPDSRFLAYVKFAPAHFVRWVSSEYLVYDLTGTPEANRSGRARVPTSDRYNVGIPVYPQGSLNRPGDNILTDQALTHAVSSDGFFWLDQSRFAFVDRWQGVNRLVVVDLRDGINQARVRVKPIETSDIVDLSLCKDADPIDFDRWSEDPAILMYVVNIRKSQAKIGFLTLDFNPTSPCLRRTSLDVALNWSLAD